MISSGNVVVIFSAVHFYSNLNTPLRVLERRLRSADGTSFRNFSGVTSVNYLEFHQSDSRSWVRSDIIMESLPTLQIKASRIRKYGRLMHINLTYILF